MHDRQIASSYHLEQMGAFQMVMSHLTCRDLDMLKPDHTAIAFNLIKNANAKF